MTILAKANIKNKNRNKNRNKNKITLKVKLKSRYFQYNLNRIPFISILQSAHFYTQPKTVTSHWEPEIEIDIDIEADCGPSNWLANKPAGGKSST